MNDRVNSKLQHRQVHAAINTLHEAKVLNLEAPISSLVNPIAESLIKSNAGSEVGLHILCCNEYALVTGLQAREGIDEVAQLAESIRSAIAAPTK